MTESVIDFPKDGLCPEIWEKVVAADGMREVWQLKPDVRTKIQEVFEHIVEATLQHFNIIHITGSITSNSYIENADIDMHLLSDEYEADEARAEEINKTVRAAYKKTFIGKHPIEVYYLSNKFQDMMSVGCYDFFKNKWLVGPELTDQSFNPYSEYYQEIQAKSEELALQIRNMIFSIYEIAVVMKKNIANEFGNNIRSVLVAKLEAVLQMYDNIRQMRKVYSSPATEEQALEYRSSRKWKVADGAFKLFDKYGYMAILKQFIEDYKLIQTSHEVDIEVVDDILNTVKHYINNADKLSEKEIFEDEQYEPPYTLQQIKDKYPADIYAKLSKCPIHRWRAETGIELVHKEPNRAELERIWKNWNLMDQKKKGISDKKSIELFGKTNAEHYKELSETELDEGAKEAISMTLLAALLAIPGIAEAKTVHKEMKKAKTEQRTAVEAVDRMMSTTRKIGDYTEAQIANAITRTLYNEAQEDGDKGLYAVASVIFNRAEGNAADFVNVCKKRKQFSCWNKMTDEEWMPENFKVRLSSTVTDNNTNMKIWEKSKQIASDMVKGKFKPTINANAYYAPKKVMPDWDKDLVSRQMIGHHLFGILKNHSQFT